MEDPNLRSLMDYALRALARRAHTSHELLVKLRRRANFTEALGTRVIQRLEELKLLNDTELIKSQLLNAVHYRHQGHLKVASKLYKKGIPLSQTKAAWVELKKSEQLSERELALAALEKAKKRFQNLPPQKQYQRRAQFLASRGFSPELTFELAKPDESL
ncbi:regulatory protein RecX [Candidatus Peregrinibacteria bacterium]|nr:MAG: regulatory protein RecX [Candidatus Peregrinibacteria bacterium]